jgi:phosphoglycolate phosphatase-like HAD superfamily hydrolase
VISCGRSSTATASATRPSGCSRTRCTTASSRCSTTAKPEVTARRIIEHFGLTDRFTVLAGATFEPGRRTKAEVIDHALRELRIGGGPHVVMVGDRDHDVHGAHAHGIGTVGVLWGYGSAEELTLAGAAALAAVPADVVDHVDRGIDDPATSGYAHRHAEPLA